MRTNICMDRCFQKSLKKFSTLTFTVFPPFKAAYKQNLSAFQK